MNRKLLVHRFRIQYVSDLPKNKDFTNILKPAAPYLAIVGMQRTQETQETQETQRMQGITDDFLTWAAPRWKHIVCLDSLSNTNLKPYKNIHFLETTPSFYCEEENVVLLKHQDEYEIAKWAYRGALICVLANEAPRLPTHPTVRLWIHGNGSSCSHTLHGKTLVLTNPYGTPGWRPDVWMEFTTMDPQEAEAIAKRHHTPLRIDAHSTNKNEDILLV